MYVDRVLAWLHSESGPTRGIKADLPIGVFNLYSCKGSSSIRLCGRERNLF